MDRIKVPSQSKQSLENVFDNLQNYIKTNIDKRISVLFDSFGIKSLINGDDLKISLTSGTNFNINPGVGMTNDYEIIKLTNITGYNLSSAINSLTAQNITLATNTFYVVKLYWKLFGSMPIAVANSFNYNAATTLPEEQRYSKYSDSFVLSVETITSGNMPTAQSNEIMLAIIKTDAATINELATGWTSFNTGSETLPEVDGVVDIRHLNFLSQSDIKITDGNTLETTSITPSGTGLIIQSNDNLPIDFKTAADEALLKIDNLNRKIQITAADNDTTALEVTGKATFSGDVYSNGWKVLTEEVYALQEILNFRVVNICSVNKMHSTNYKDSSFNDGDFAYDKGSRDRLRLNLEWGYNTITGTGGSSGTFTVTSGETWANNALAGYHLWVPGSPGTNYYIASNTGNILTLHSSYQTVASTSGLVVSSPNYAKINHNVTQYEIAAVPYDSAGDADDRDVKSEIITYGSSPVVMKRGLILESGVKYNLKIRGIRNEVIGPWTPLLWSSSTPNGASGSFTYMGVTYNYGANGDILLKHVTLTDSGATLSAVATASGFKLTLAPGGTSYDWSNAEEYEFAWSGSGTTINWSDPSTFESKITPHYTLSVATYDSTEYNISVRPLIGRMSVGTPINTTVISGTGGALPANNIIATAKVEHYTFSAAAYSSYDPVSDEFEFTGNIYSPSESTNIASYTSLKAGYIMTVGGYDYRLARKVNDTKWKIAPVGHTNSPAESGSGVSLEINTSKRGRRVYSSTLPADTQITKLEAVCDVHEGEDVMIRVFQNAGTRESFADYVIVNGSSQSFSSASDHLILSSYGDRELIIDLWDNQTSPDSNDGSFVGTINVYGQTYTAKAYDKLASVS